jgi:hypothetical protein
MNLYQGQGGGGTNHHFGYLDLLGQGCPLLYKISIRYYNLLTQYSITIKPSNQSGGGAFPFSPVTRGKNSQNENRKMGIRRKKTENRTTCTVHPGEYSRIREPLEEYSICVRDSHVPYISAQTRPDLAWKVAYRETST